MSASKALVEQKEIIIVCETVLNRNYTYTLTVDRVDYNQKEINFTVAGDAGAATADFIIENKGKRILVTYVMAEGCSFCIYKAELADKVEPTASVKTVIVDTGRFSPSFDCTMASNDPERLICSDRDLAKLDVQLGQSYSKAVGSAADKKKMQLDQLDWLKRERNACSDKPCMAGAIEQRIKALFN